MSAPTVFHKIMSREIPAKIVYEDDRALAFWDINPQAPVHVLVIPREDLTSLQDVTEANAELVGHLFVVVNRVAADLGLADGYRVVINCGRDGGQEVPHLHLHLLGRRRMQWPPG